MFEINKAYETRICSLPRYQIPRFRCRHCLSPSDSHFHCCLQAPRKTRSPAVGLHQLSFRLINFNTVLRNFFSLTWTVRLHLTSIDVAFSSVKILKENQLSEFLVIPRISLKIFPSHQKLKKRNGKPTCILCSDSSYCRCSKPSIRRQRRNL